MSAHVPPPRRSSALLAGLVWIASATSGCSEPESTPSADTVSIPTWIPGTFLCAQEDGPFARLQLDAAGRYEAVLRAEDGGEASPASGRWFLEAERVRFEPEAGAEGSALLLREGRLALEQNRFWLRTAQLAVPLERERATSSPGVTGKYGVETH